MKVPGMIASALDKRADKIRNELEEARKLREEAQALLAEYQKKRKEAEKEAADIVERRQARGRSDLREEAKEDRGICQPPHRDGRAEDRGRPNPMPWTRFAPRPSTGACGRNEMIGDKVTGKPSTDLFKKSLDEVKTRLN
jgi:F-type H+-transporting ATPase subunit b